MKNDYFDLSDSQRLRTIAEYMRKRSADDSFEVEEDLERIAKRMELLQYTNHVLKVQIKRESHYTICQRIADKLTEAFTWKKKRKEDVRN